MDGKNINIVLDITLEKHPMLAKKSHRQIICRYGNFSNCIYCCNIFKVLWRDRVALLYFFTWGVLCIVTGLRLTKKDD